MHRYHVFFLAGDYHAELDMVFQNPIRPVDIEPMRQDISRSIPPPYQGRRVVLTGMWKYEDAPQPPLGPNEVEVLLDGERRRGHVLARHGSLGVTIDMEPQP